MKYKIQNAKYEVNCLSLNKSSGIKNTDSKLKNKLEFQN